MARLRVRAFAAQDAPGVAALHARTHEKGAWSSDAACAGYFREILLHNPWRDPELPSWVAEDGGHIVGFFGVMPRRMRFGERQIRVAVGCQLMVDPDHRRSFAALALVKRFFSGPQDLSIADGANDAARRCWEACGGLASPLHMLHWMRLLRPARRLLQVAAERRGLGVLGALCTPLALLADACVAGVLPARRAPGMRYEALSVTALIEAIHQHRGAFTLRPDYDTGALEWLLDQARSKRRHGALQAALLRDASDRVTGWFVYYLSTRVSKVLTAGANREHMPAVLEALFQHARERGALAIEGRLEPHLAPALNGKRCLLKNRGIATLLHARDPALLVPFLRGDVLFTRLEGEWWTRFVGEPAASTAQPAAPAAKKQLAPVPAPPV